MNDTKIPAVIPVTGTIEDALREFLQGKPPGQRNDYAGMARHIQKRMEGAHLVISRKPDTPDQRALFRGPIRDGEHVLAIADGRESAIVFGTGIRLGTMPKPLRERIWKDMLAQALNDMENAGASASEE